MGILFLKTSTWHDLCILNVQVISNERWQVFVDVHCVTHERYINMFTHSTKHDRQCGCFESFPFCQKICYFRPPDHVILMECKALDFRCQCIQQKFLSICAVLTFDPQLKKNIRIFCKRQISIKLFYLYQRLQCRDNYFFKIKFVFFLYLLLSAS